MTLFDLWRSDPSQIREKQVRQLIAFAGEGTLRDGNDTSRELKELLENLPTDHIEVLVQECLSGTKFEGSGFVLQDLINEAGSRLGFEVINGRYRGVSGAILPPSAVEETWKAVFPVFDLRACIRESML